MTRSFWILIFTLVSILFIGLLSLNGGMLILLLPLLVYLAAAIWLSPPVPQLQVTRNLSAEKITEGTSLQVSVEVTNEGSHLEEVMIEDHLPGSLKPVEGRNQARVNLTAPGSLHLDYTLQPGRGKYRLDHLLITSSDPFGLFNQYHQIPLPATLLVSPPSKPIRFFQIRPRLTRGFAGPIPARRGGSGSDFFGIRDYQAGDPTRRINWLASGRHEEGLFTNEFEQETITDVGLILDARLSVNLVTDGSNLFEYSVLAAAGLAETLLRQGHRVSLLSFGQSLQRVFPGYGKIQLQRILNQLAQIKPGMNYALESLKSLPTRLFPASSQLILITPLVKEDREALLGLCAQGYSLLVLSPQFDPAGLRFDPEILPEAHRLKQIEYRLLIRDLKRAGIRVAEWQVDRPLENAIRAVSWQSIQLQRIRNTAR